MTAKPTEEPIYRPEQVPVHVAIARIMGDLPAIGKDERMSGGGMSYNYRGIETITAHVQPLLVKHGVVIVPSSTITSIEPALDAKPGWQDVVLSIDWLIIGPDGSTLNARTVGIGRDSGDKGSNKCSSQAFKYLLLHLFCIADSGDDSDGMAYDSLAEHEVEVVIDPVFELFEAVKAAKGTPLGDEVRSLADAEDKKLSTKAFKEDPAWTSLVVATIENFQRETEDIDV